MCFQYCLSDKPEIRQFDPSRTAEQKYPITQYQPVYFVAETFEDAKEKMRYELKGFTRVLKIETTGLKAETAWKSEQQ